MKQAQSERCYSSEVLNKQSREKHAQRKRNVKRALLSFFAFVLGLIVSYLLKL